MADRSLALIIKGQDQTSGVLAGIGKAVDGLSGKLGGIAKAAGAASFTGLASGLGTVARAAGSVNLGGLTSSLGGLASAASRVSLGGLSSGLGGLSGAFHALPNAIGGAVRGLGAFGLAVQGVRGIVDTVKGVVGGLFGVGGLNELEQTRASIQAFTKDSAQTEKVLALVRDEAAKTPFAFGEMARAAASLMPVAKASGIALKDLLTQAEILAASNPLEGLEGASFSLREAMTGDFTSIIERFNLSRQTINKLKDEGLPSIEIVRRAMAEMGFDIDLVASKAETFEGRWSTFLDTLAVLQQRAGQPIFDALKDSLVVLQKLLDASTPLLEQFADAIAGRLRSALASAGTALAGFATTAGTALRALRGIFDGVVNEEALSDVKRFGEGLDKVFGQRVTSAVTGFVTALGKAWRELQSILPTALGAIKTAFDNVVGVTGRLIQTLGPVATWLAERIPGAVRGAAEAFGQLQQAIRTALVFSQGEGLGGFLAELFSQLSGLGSRLFTEIANQVGSIDWAGIWARITTAGSTLLSTVAAWIAGLASRLGTWIGDQVSQISWSAVWQRVGDVLGGLASAFVGLTVQLALWIGDAVSRIPWGAIWSAVKDVRAGMEKWFTGLHKEFETWLGDEAGEIHWSEVWKKATLNASTIMAAVVKGDLELGTWANDQIKAVNWVEVGAFFGKVLAAAFKAGFTSATSGGGGLEAATIRKAIGDFVLGVIRGAIDVDAIGRIFANGLKGGWGIAIAQAAIDLLPKLRDAFLRLLEAAWRIAVSLFDPSLARVRFTIDIEAWGRQILNALQGAWGFAIARAVLTIGANAIRTVTGGGGGGSPAPGGGGPGLGPVMTPGPGNRCPPGTRLIQLNGVYWCETLPTGGGRGQAPSPRADGGPVGRDGMYWVGERGPELFVSSASGSIIANDKLGGRGGVTISVTVAQGAVQVSGDNGDGIGHRVGQTIAYALEALVRAEESTSAGAPAFLAGSY